MIEFALLAGLLVAIVIATLWKLRPREIDSVDTESATGSLIEPVKAVERRPNLLDTARSEHSPEFRESLAALIMRDRWEGTVSPDLDELRHIVTGWTGKSTPPGSTADNNRADPPPGPMDAFVSKVSAAAGAGVVEIRLRRGSNVDVLVARPGQGARRPISLS